MKRIIKTLAVGTVMASIAGIASATPSIYWSTTGAAGSWNVVNFDASGHVPYSGGDANWTFSGTGLTMPLIGSANQPIMDLGLSATSLNAGSLYIALVANGYTAASGGVVASFTGQAVTGSESFNFNTYADTSNLMPGHTIPTVGTPITSLSGLMPPNANSTTGIGTLPGSVPFTLEEVVEITSIGGGSTTSVDASFSSVPDGATTASLLGSALFGLALLKRKITA